ncbi:hypothetical protein FY028_005090 [Cyclobacterium marinum]|nr:PEP/pyruvate-binding domain-containing protein [Cyclobacterium marinum]MBI0398096.1 hypothetical protein [Cyclobacterium marinum]
MSDKGIGENVVQGSVNTGEFLVFKPFLGKVNQAIISRNFGTKIKTMIYSEKSVLDIVRPEDAIININTPLDRQQVFKLSDEEVAKLAQWIIL